MQRRGRERLDGLAAGVGSELGLEALEGSGVGGAVEGLGDGVVGRAVAGRPREVSRLAKAGGRKREVLGPRGEVGVEGRGDDGERVGSGSSDTLPDSVNENGREVAEKRRTRNARSATGRQKERNAEGSTHTLETSCSVRLRTPPKEKVLVAPGMLSLPVEAVRVNPSQVASKNESMTGLISGKVERKRQPGAKGQVGKTKGTHSSC